MRPNEALQTDKVKLSCSLLAQANKSLHRPTGACHGSCSKGNSRARRLLARELKR